MVKSSMNRIKRNDVAVVPVGSEGGRSPSALSTGESVATAAGCASGPLGPGQRWSVSRKREVVFRLLRGEAAEDLSRELGVAALQTRALAAEGRSRAGWRVEGTRGGCGHRRARRGHAADRRTEHRERVAAVSDRACRPFGPQEVAVMAAAMSPTTGRRYGVAQVCRVWGMPRSSFYADRRRGSH